MSNLALVQFPNAVEDLDHDKFNMDGLPRISDNKHYERALETGSPHTYISKRAGLMSFDGEDGIGFINAVQIHKRIFEQNGFELKDPDIAEAQKHSPSIRTTLEELGFFKRSNAYDY